MVDRITAPSRILLHLIPGVPREFARSKLNREEDIPGARKPFPGFTLFGAAALFLISKLNSVAGWRGQELAMGGGDAIIAAARFGS